MEQNVTLRTASLYEKGHFTGATIAKDFSASGYISVTFRATDKDITPVSVNGFEISGNTKYKIYPKSLKDAKVNKSFINRFFSDLEEYNKLLLCSYADFGL